MKCHANRSFYIKRGDVDRVVQTATKGGSGNVGLDVKYAEEEVARRATVEVVLGSAVLIPYRSKGGEHVR